MEFQVEISLQHVLHELSMLIQPEYAELLTDALVLCHIAYTCSNLP